MNKIVTINIGGIAITIEEDAFDSLRDYLKNIGNHFRDTENGDEIIADIELRVGEMLQAKLNETKVSINMQDVEDVAQTMGYPSDFEAEAEPQETTSGNETEEPKQKDAKTKSSSRAKRRLFRDIDNQQIGGVCAGLAKYLDFDPTVLRILWLVSLLVFGFGFWIYIILWAILPGAKTTAEKLEMMGESPNIENIKNTIHSEAKAAYDRIASPENRKSVSHFFESFFGFLKRVFGAFFKLFAVMAFVGIIVLLISSMMGILFNGHFFNLDSNIRIDGNVFNVMVLGAGSWFFKIAFYLIFAIPLVYLAIHILPEVLSAVPKPSKPVKQSMISGWFLAIILAIIGFFYNAREYQSEGTATVVETLDVNSDTIILRVDDLLAEEYTKTRRNIKLDVIQSSGNNVELKVQKSARGRNEDVAKESTEAIAPAHRLTNNTLLLSEKVLLNDKRHITSASLFLTVKVPIGHTVIFHESTKRIIHHVDNLQNIYDANMAGHVFYMSEAGFRCEDCSEKISKQKYNSMDGDYNELEVNGALTVRVIEGNESGVDIPARDDGRKWVDVDISDNKIELTQKKSFVGEDEVITIQLSNLKALEVAGSCKVTLDASDNEKSYFDLRLTGASEVEVNNIISEKISIDGSGGSMSTFAGKTDLLLLELNGASNFNGNNLTTENANVDMSGASKASAEVTSELTGDLNAASNFSYSGNPSIKVDSSAGASLNQTNP